MAVDQNIIYDSLDEAVKNLVQGSYLSNSEYQYTPLQQLGELADSSAWPKITSDVSIGSVLGQRVDFELKVSILFIPIGLDVCQTSYERERRINAQGEFHIRVLIEVYRWMIGMNKMPDGQTYRDYNYSGEARLRKYAGIRGLNEEGEETLLYDDIVAVEINIPLYDSYANICCTVLNPSS